MNFKMLVPTVKRKLGLPANVEGIWDNRAEEFHKHRWVNQPKTEKEFEKQVFGELEKLDLDGCSFMELGCGYGKFLMQAEKKFPNSSFTGIDFSEEMIKICKKNVKRANVFKADLTKYNFGKCDVIFSQDCLDHLNNRQMKKLAPKITNAIHKYFIVVERNADKYYAHPNNYVFWHNYPEVFKDLKLVKMEKDKVGFKDTHTIMIFKK